MTWLNCVILEEQHYQSHICGPHSLLPATSSGNDSGKLLNQPTEANQSARKGVGEMTGCHHLQKKMSLFLFFSSVEKVCGTKAAVTFYRK